MTDALRTAGDYELFIYTIAERFPAIERSTLRFIRRGATLARVVGELHDRAGMEDSPFELVCLGFAAYGAAASSAVVKTTLNRLQ